MSDKMLANVIFLAPFAVLCFAFLTHEVYKAWRSIHRYKK